MLLSLSHSNVALALLSLTRFIVPIEFNDLALTLLHYLAKVITIILLIPTALQNAAKICFDSEGRSKNQHE